MTTDHAKRLRNLANPGYSDRGVHHEWCAEAADEIDRLMGALMAVQSDPGVGYLASNLQGHIADICSKE